MGVEHPSAPGLLHTLRPAPSWSAHAAAAAAYWILVAAAGLGMFAVVRTGDVPPAAPAEGAGLQSMVGRRSEALVIGGTGTGLAVLEVLSREFEKETGIPVSVASSIGSSGGLAALVAGAVDLAWVSRPLKPGELEKLRVVELAQARVFLAGGRLADPSPLLPGEVADLYLGRREVWPDGTPVVVVLREPGDSGTLAFGEIVPGFAAAHEWAVESRFWRVELSDLAMQRALLDCPGAVGLFDLGAKRGLDLALKEIPVLSGPGGNELIPVRPLSLVSHLDRVDPRVDRFIEFATGASAGRLLAEWGYQAPRVGGAR